MAHQRQPNGGSYPPPLFVAELDGSHHRNDTNTASYGNTASDGTPIYEMAADTFQQTTKPDDAALKRPERKESEYTELAANPWPYHGPIARNDDTTTKPIAATQSQDFTRPPDPEGEMNKADGRRPGASIAPSYAVESQIPGVDAPHDARPTPVSPMSPSASYFPAPLNIGRPPQTQTTPARTESPKYKPYSPPVYAHNTGPQSPPLGTSSPPPPQGGAAVGGGVAHLAYRPYRRPSFKDESMSTPASSQQHISGPGSPKPEPPKSTGTPPYPTGAAPHHFYMPEAPPIPDEVPRPANRPHGDTRVNDFAPVASTSPRPHVTNPGVEEAAMRPPPTGTTATPAMSPLPPAQQTEDILPWSHPAALSPRLDAALGPRPDVPAQPTPPAALSPRPDVQSQPMPPAALGPRPEVPPQPTPPPVPYQSISPNITGASTVSSIHSIAAHAPPPPPQVPLQASPPPPATSTSYGLQPGYISSPSSPPVPQQAAHSVSPSSTSYGPQPGYTSPLASPPLPQHGSQSPGSGTSHSPHPQKMGPTMAEPPIPQSPPPAYDAVASGASSQARPTEKPSLFPQAPSSAPQTPFPQQNPAQQPTYAPFPTQGTSSAPQTPHPQHYPAQQPLYASPPPHQPHTGHSYGQSPPPVAQPVYASPPPPGHGSPAQSLHAPPLPPRPTSSHNGPAPAGFGHAPPPPMAYPAPPKTNYVPSGNPSASSSRPPTSAGGKLLNSALGNKWVQKTNKFVESKIGEVLQNHPDPKYRPQPGTYGYQGQPQQYLAGQQQAQQHQYQPQAQGQYVPQQQQQQQQQYGFPQQTQYAQPGSRR